MVTVTDYAIHQRKDGTDFITLELTGGLELVQSQNTGNFYATVRKCSIPSTINETMAQQVIGTTMQGEVVRVSCDPYEFINKRTGEIMTLSHSYAYRPANAVELVGHSRVEEMQAA